MATLSSRRAVLAQLAACGLLAGCADDRPRSPVLPPTTPPSQTTDPVETPSPTRTPPPAPPPPPSPEELAERVWGQLSAEERLGELFVVGVPAEDPGRAAGLLDDPPVGGVFLSGRSGASVADVRTLVDGWQSRRGPSPLWIATDHEGGQVQLLRGSGFDRLPSALEQGRSSTADLRDRAAVWARQLATAGVNLDFAPVADLVDPAHAADNAPIGRYDRQYGGSAEAVQASAGAVVEGLAAAGVTATLKHFPGLGRVRENTDYADRVVDRETGPDSAQVRTFARLAASPAAPFVMVSTAVYAQIDPDAPAAFSQAVVTDLLRTRLGVEAVVITDDLGRARAVRSVPVGQRATRALAAGVSLVLTAEPSTLAPMVAAVRRRRDRDPAFARACDDAARRSLQAKARRGLLGPTA